ncbi:PREDICTED: uncharacterized protein LOC109191911 isoform X1 [Ipomoea nil]|uniref:uncharacterized protein LOC109191911 isoform X1 n=1 Tax=Ipomoea nil TaxID=35883 RepID=UPI0009012004|nr:PREDICTED: uncharacterized protein LOC109191911 isoform X1 [Ipomoea nil]
MARIRSWCSRSRHSIFIWFVCALTFCTLFNMALRNSSEWSISNSDKRLRLYDKMERDLEEHGASFLKHGETSQSLALSDLFTLKDGIVTPVLKAANPSVRANVLHLSTDYSVPIAVAVRSMFSPYFERAIWFQNSSIYHCSMFHASHHVAPVPASEAEIEAEANSVEAVAKASCPLDVVLDRVVLTSTGVLIGCWQVVSGTDPVTIREKLRNALPHAPEKQFYDAAILHTSFARLLGPPTNLPEEAKNLSVLQFFHELVTRLNSQIRGFKATITELWYVEEHDLLALAVDGKMTIRKFQLGCSKA